jgi:hypothetical protein
MNLQSLVVVLLRLVSLNFLLQAFYQLLPQLIRFSELYRNLDRDGSSFLLALPLMLMMGLIIGAGLLWAFAMPIARLVTRGLPADLSFGALSLSDCYSILFVGLGLFYAAGSFPRVLNWIHYLLKMEASRLDDSWRTEMNWYEVSQAFLSFIVGMILFVNGRKWAVALASRQTKNIAESAPVHPEQRNDP